MTNVPEKIREMWADVYKLFDINYRMQNDMESWNRFWKQATEIWNKYGSTQILLKLIDTVALMIEDRMKKESIEPNDPRPTAWENMTLF